MAAWRREREADMSTVRPSLRESERTRSNAPPPGISGFNSKRSGGVVRQDLRADLRSWETETVLIPPNEPSIAPRRSANTMWSSTTRQCIRPESVWFLYVVRISPRMGIGGLWRLAKKEPPNVNAAR